MVFIAIPAHFLHFSTPFQRFPNTWPVTGQTLRSRKHLKCTTTPLGYTANTLSPIGIPHFSHTGGLEINGKIRKNHVKIGGKHVEIGGKHVKISEKHVKIGGKHVKSIGKQ
jgi:hypothetical protein